MTIFYFLLFTTIYLILKLSLCSHYHNYISLDNCTRLFLSCIWPAAPRVTLPLCHAGPCHTSQCHTPATRGHSPLSSELKGINRREESSSAAGLTQTRSYFIDVVHIMFPHEAITDTWPCLCGTGGEAKLSTEKFTRFDSMIN